MPVKQTIEYESYRIRAQNTTVKGHHYTRYAVDFGTDAKGKHKRAPNRLGRLDSSTHV